MDDHRHSGTLDSTYAETRETKLSHRYRLKRRAAEVARAIERYSDSSISTILDLGTADGRGLQLLSKRFSSARCLGIEHDSGLLAYGRELHPTLDLRQGDIHQLELPAGSCDVVVAAAVIEHVPSPDKVICEARRVLRDGGIFVLTSPDPRWEKVATALGHLDAEQHNEVLNLDQLSLLVFRHGFSVLETRKFMFSPVGFPFERRLEQLLIAAQLDFMLANQLLVARKVPTSQ